MSHGQGEGPVGSKLSRSDDADDDGRGRSERSERSPIRGKLPPLRSLAHQKEEADPFFIFPVSLSYILFSQQKGPKR
jgi:hypothetical protein